MSLQGKRILLFIPYFFGYPTKICDKMKQLGAEVFLYNERSIDSSLDKMLLKISVKLFRRKTKKYYRNIIVKHQGEHFDYILFVKCEMPSNEDLGALKNSFPQAKLCLHLWDSVENVKGIQKKIPLFDRVTSFDTKDCEKYGFIFRPLFFSDEFRSVSGLTKSNTYDLAFCGTLHSDRYEIIKKIVRQCEEMGLRYYGFHYLQSKAIYPLYKMTKKEFRGTKKQDFSFEKMSGAQVAEIENQSTAILDIQHPLQSGLTMRTIETMGMQKKMITTNMSIVDYDFYDANNICVLDRKNPIINKEFFATPYRQIDEKIYYRYTLETWIYDVLGVEREEQLQYAQ